MIWSRGTFVAELGFSSPYPTLFEDQDKPIFIDCTPTFFALVSLFIDRSHPFNSFADPFQKAQPPQL